MASIPPHILNAWRLQHGIDDRVKNAHEPEGWTPSSLAKSHMKFQLDQYYRTPPITFPSLSSLTVGKILDNLRSSEHLAKDAQKIAKSLNWTTLRLLLQDPRASYQALRALLLLPQTDKRSLVDIDEAVLGNERYIRSQGLLNQDGRNLVSLKDLFNILSETAAESKPTEITRNRSDKPFQFIRKDPSEGGLEVLYFRRETQMSIIPSNQSFRKVFKQTTRGILNGLDWNNVMVAGGMALMTLLNVGPFKDCDESIKDPGIDLYIYGLGPEDANRKVEEIHDVWARNLPAGTGERVVVKSAKKIMLLATHSYRRIQIVLKLFPCPTDVLLNIDLDACAIGFDGEQVLMLPRCARAIETGYSVFTMDLVWGHHLGGRRPAQERRLFQYANCGFGVRFLPFYARSLEETAIAQRISKTLQLPVNTVDSGDKEGRLHEPPYWNPLDPKSDEDEPGLEKLKLIASRARQLMHRYCFGANPLVNPFPHHREQNPAHQFKFWDGEKSVNVPHDDEYDEYFNVVEDVEDVEDDRDNEDDEDDVDASEDEWRELVEEPELDSEVHKPSSKVYGVPVIHLCDLENESYFYGLPNGRRGLGNFEVFLRHCEAWLFHSLDVAVLDDRSPGPTLDYDPDIDNYMSNYHWNTKFDVDSFDVVLCARNIDSHNNSLWDKVKVAICDKLGIDPPVTSGYANYSTRRIRREVYGPDFKAVQEKQITIPVNIPSDLEHWLLDIIPQEFTDLPSHFTDFKPLIPIHDTTKHDPATATIPSLQDKHGVGGNLRYWVITNKSMWAGQHRVLDEFSELMWSFATWFARAGELPRRGGKKTHDNVQHSCWALASLFKRRIVLSDALLAARDQSVDMESEFHALRESVFFRAWVMKVPDT